jgi:hypothetical protein
VQINLIGLNKLMLPRFDRAGHKEDKTELSELRVELNGLQDSFVTDQLIG